MFNATFSNVSGISLRSVLFVEKTTDLQKVTNELYYVNVVSNTLIMSGIRIHNLSDDNHWLHMQLQIQLPYDHDQDGA